MIPGLLYVWRYDRRGAILKSVYETAKGNDHVNGHVPDMVSYKAYPLTSTSVIQKRLGPQTDGPRVLRPIVFQELKPITELVGDEFLQAWLETVKCHLVLWKNDVRHRDVCPNNLMYRVVDGKVVGVLNDFDLALIGDDVAGTERTGTVPFMALDLLEIDARDGRIKHLYEHDAESFIWVLTWVALRYDNGKLREKNRPFEAWLKGDARTWCEHKCGFLLSRRRLGLVPGVGHERNKLQVANACLTALVGKAVSHMMGPEGVRQPLEVDTAFQQLIARPLESRLNLKT